MCVCVVGLTAAETAVEVAAKDVPEVELDSPKPKEKEKNLNLKNLREQLTESSGPSVNVWLLGCRWPLVTVAAVTLRL